MEWSELDLDAAEWRIPAGKMKMREAHLVPLSSQAVVILRELQPVTGWGRYVFPGLRTPQRPERQLAHAERNKVRAVYNRAQYMAERRKMMQAWADYPGNLRTGGNVIPIKRGVG